jgi:hypothetical protein
MHHSDRGLQRQGAQPLGVAFACFGKFDNQFGDRDGCRVTAKPL